MSTDTQARFLEDQLRLLVVSFGAGPVAAALARATQAAAPLLSSPTAALPPRDTRANRSLLKAIEELRVSDEEKARALTDFYTRLLSRAVLPAAEDFRHIASRIGIKHLVGKSRVELVNALIRFLLEQPVERVRRAVEIAPEISQRQRDEAYAVLTEGLLGPRPDRRPA